MPNLKELQKQAFKDQFKKGFIDTLKWAVPVGVIAVGIAIAINRLPDDNDPDEIEEEVGNLKAWLWPLKV